MRHLLLLLTVALCLPACGEGELSPAADLDPEAPPVTDGTWYQPNRTTSWQWQLEGTVNTGYDVDVYDIDLFDSPESLIADLQAAGRTVFCYFSAGSSEDHRSDFGDFLDTDMGSGLQGWPGENWLDVRSQNVVDIMGRRLDLAASKGCDGVEPDNMDGFDNNSGFDLSEEDQLAFNRFIGNEARSRGLSVLLKNDGPQVEELVDYYDGSLNEECHAFEECEDLQAFLDADKPVFNAEYPAGDPDVASDTICPAAQAFDSRTLVLPLDLDDSYRIDCDAWTP
jgi:hypothetical protein